MRTATAHERHRAHHTRPAGLAVFAIALLAACKASLPRPEAAAVSVSDYVAVPFGPRVPPVEFIPPAPAKDAVWVDGTWEWTGERYGWRAGTWVVPPSGVRYAPWVVVRRKEDGQLFFARSSWKDDAGNVVDERFFIHALGLRARARSRPGVSPTDESSLAGRSPAASAPPAPPESAAGKGEQGGRGESEEGDD